MYASVHYVSFSIGRILTFKYLSSWTLPLAHFYRNGMASHPQEFCQSELSRAWSVWGILVLKDTSTSLQILLLPHPLLKDTLHLPVFLSQGGSRGIVSGCACCDERTHCGRLEVCQQADGRVLWRQHRCCCSIPEASSQDKRACPSWMVQVRIHCTAYSSGRVLRLGGHGGNHTLCKSRLPMWV